MRFKATISYDGTQYLGFQSQKGGGAIQDVIESALEKIFKRKVRLHGASRTDSGVHAIAQAGHFDAQWNHPTAKLQKALNGMLPEDIRISRLQKLSSDFHARFSSNKKQYTYILKTAPASPFDTRYCWALPFAIDQKLLRKALKSFEGKYNFSAFAGRVLKGENPVKEIYKISLKQEGDYLKIKIVGSGFLYKMVRSLVGFAVEVARGKSDLAKVAYYLKKSPKRTHEIVTAPARGLCLDKVFYPIAQKDKKP